MHLKCANKSIVYYSQERLLRSRNMFKFFKKHPPKEGEEREKLKKELFEFQKVSEAF